MINPRKKKPDARTSGPIDNGDQRAKYNKSDGKKRPIKHEENLIMRAVELRKMLGVGKNTIYDWCRQGMLPHKRVGRVILFSRIKIKEWLENGENVGGAS